MSTSAKLLALLLALILAGPAAHAADQLKIGDGRGSIDFAIGDSKIFRTTGGFKHWQGNVTVDEPDVSRSSVEVTVKTDSIQMLDTQQTAMLKDSDFFDVAKFPQMTFRSTKIVRTGDNTLKVDGDITLRGITRPMALDVTVSDRKPDAAPGARYARFRGVGTIKRSEFGMTKYIDMVGDTVEFIITADAWR
ncbi:MAG: YceI family protein [Reyranellaceae bacterium]